MSKLNVVIIGAGAAGLMAAREIAKSGMAVAVLEARDRIGGRIHTIHTDDFSIPVEAGAEFVHGDLPTTLQLLEEAGILVEPMQGKTWQVQNGEVGESQEFIEGWSMVIDTLNKLEEDMSIADFLAQYFGDDNYRVLRESVGRYVEGYDAADTHRASAFALREEWAGEEESTQYRLPGGYSQLLDFLADEVRALGWQIHMSTLVKEIHWKPGQVKVILSNGEVFTAAQALITVPLGVLQSKVDDEGHITFVPPLPEKQAASKQLGFGSVIKFLLEFKDAFWEGNANESGIRKMPELGFLFSDAPIPTWWTQLPQTTPMLTGWFAGPDTDHFRGTTEAVLLEKALDSLSAIFQLSTAQLRDKLVASKVINWADDPFARGAYTYATVGGKEAAELLKKNVENTLFFAGEALYSGPEIGTVEAALASGQEVARELLIHSRAVE